MNVNGTPEISFRPYLLNYALVLVILYIMLGIINIFILSSPSLKGVSLIMPFLAVSFTGEYFLKKENRTPTKAEGEALAARVLSVAILVNVVLSVPAFQFGAYDLNTANVDTGFFIILVCIFGFVLAINYFL